MRDGQDDEIVYGIDYYICNRCGDLYHIVDGGCLSCRKEIRDEKLEILLRDRGDTINKLLDEKM